MTRQRYYFSRLRLRGDTADIRALARIAASDAYREHRLVWQFFPDDADAARDFLYRREESSAQRGALTYFVVSRRPPHPDNALWIVDTKDYAPELTVGDRYEFFLRANPVKHRKQERSPEDEAAFLARRQAAGLPPPRDTGRRKRDDAIHEAKKTFKEAFGDAWTQEYNAVELEHAAGFAWIEAQGQRLGFAVRADEVSTSGYRQERFKTRGGRCAEFSRLDFAGRLTVTDPERFGVALLDGVGPAKAFGCGLLTIRRSTVDGVDG